ncbi:MAG: hypothetical protein ACREJB_13280, partial [Planctomycetaceae bacterium]
GEAERPIIHELCPHCGEPQAQRLITGAVRICHECGPAPLLRRIYRGDEVLFVPAARWTDALPDRPGTWLVKWQHGEPSTAEVYPRRRGPAPDPLWVSVHGRTLPVEQMHGHRPVECCYGPIPQPLR